MTGKRLAAIAVILVLSLFLGALARTSMLQLQDLSTAETDNMQWTILQVETEIANLHVAVSNALAEAPADLSHVRLRADIALSRFGPIKNGRTRDLFAEDAEAEALLGELYGFSADLVSLLDAPGPLTRADLFVMRDAIAQIRPTVREMALFGLERGVARSQERRMAFASQIRRTGGTAIALIMALGVLLLVLDRVLARMRDRDAALRASSDRLSSTVEASLDAIVVADEAGRIVQFNSAAEQIFGWTSREIIGQKMDATIIPHQHRHAHATGMERYLSTHVPHVVGGGRVELSGLRKTGEEFPVEINITSVKSGEGELFIAYLRDISLRKINEGKLIDARDKAERMDRAKSQFLAVMSHEMRTPLNGVLGVLDLLHNTPLTHQQQRYVGVAVASGEILLEHVNEALDITRIEMGSMSLTPQPFELKKTIQNTVEVLAPLAEEKGLTLELAFDPQMDRHFFADSGRINQILTNLIGNAIKFTETGGIFVEVTGIHTAGATQATLAVRDTGPGIAPEHHEAIFEDFVALAFAKGRQTRSDGLGLSIARKTARLMGGDLTVTSALGEGSTFAMALSLDHIAAPVEQVHLTLQAAHAPSAKSILIVEDNAINRSVLKDMLVGLGHIPSEAKDGLDGLNAAKAQAFDLIIMDINMPVMDGIEATRRIREEADLNRTTPILGLTAHGREEYRLRAKRAGMSAFCTKPIRIAALKDIIARLDLNDTPPDALINPEVLGELIVELGPERALSTLGKFYAEFTQMLDALRDPTDGALREDLPNALHKLRGGAVILGLSGLAIEIDKVCDAVRETDRAVLKTATQGMRDVGEIARVEASELISIRSSSPKG